MCTLRGIYKYVRDTDYISYYLSLKVLVPKFFQNGGVQLNRLSIGALEMLSEQSTLTELGRHSKKCNLLTELRAYLTIPMHPVVSSFNYLHTQND